MLGGIVLTPQLRGAPTLQSDVNSRVVLCTVAHSARTRHYSIHSTNSSHGRCCAADAALKQFTHVRSATLNCVRPEYLIYFTLLSLLLSLTGTVALVSRRITTARFKDHMNASQASSGFVGSVPTCSEEPPPEPEVLRGGARPPRSPRRAGADACRPPPRGDRAPRAAGGTRRASPGCTREGLSSTLRCSNTFGVSHISHAAEKVVFKKLERERERGDGGVRGHCSILERIQRDRERDRERKRTCTRCRPTAQAARQCATRCAPSRARRERGSTPRPHRRARAGADLRALTSSLAALLESSFPRHTRASRRQCYRGRRRPGRGLRRGSPSLL